VKWWQKEIADEILKGQDKAFRIKLRGEVLPTRDQTRKNLRSADLKRKNRSITQKYM